MIWNFSPISCIQLFHVRLTRTRFQCFLWSYINPQSNLLYPATGTNFLETRFNSSQYPQRLNNCQTIIYSATDRSCIQREGTPGIPKRQSWIRNKVAWIREKLAWIRTSLRINIWTYVHIQINSYCLFCPSKLWHPFICNLYSEPQAASSMSVLSMKRIQNPLQHIQETYLSLKAHWRPQLVKINACANHLDFEILS